MKEVVYKGRDNPNTVIVKMDGSAMDFAAVTRMVCEFKGTDVVADTSEDSSLIDWSQGGGVIVFNLNDLAVPAGLRAATLIVYDPNHQDGQTIIHEAETLLTFHFVD